MRCIEFVAVAAVVMGLVGSTSVALARDVDHAVLEEINFVRTHPQEYAAQLRRLARAGERGEYIEVSSEEPGAVEEAIAYLERQSPLPPLRDHDGLAAAARGHVADQGRGPNVGHYGSGGEDLQTRLHHQNVWAGMVAEDISYGYDDPRAVVRQLIVDSRVRDRGHREVIFSHGYTTAGVACGPHARYGAMCVIDFAGALVQR